MHEQFLKLTKKAPLKVVSFVETKSTLVTALKLNYLFVEPHSANIGVGEYYEIPQDHLCICKPLNRFVISIYNTLDTNVYFNSF